MTLSTMAIVVIAANILGAAMAVPQARKLLRTRRVDGISVTWAAVSAAVNGLWAVYAVGVGDISIVPVSVVSVCSYAVIGFGIYRFSSATAAQLLTPALLAVVSVTTIPLVAMWLGGWVAAGIALGTLYGVQLSPAVFAVYRATDVSGVSVATWVIAAVEATLWGVYGLASLDIGLLTLAGTGLLMSSLVLARLVVRRQRQAHGERPPELVGFATA